MTVRFVKMAVLAPLVVSAALLASPGYAAAAGTAAPSNAQVSGAIASPTIVTPLNVWHTYRSNWFNSLDSCNTYGKGATGNRTGTGWVAGTYAWICYQNAGQSKWSIDLYYD